LDVSETNKSNEVSFFVGSSGRAAASEDMLSVGAGESNVFVALIAARSGGLLAFLFSVGAHLL
jgi:hypothetical protein